MKKKINLFEEMFTTFFYAGYFPIGPGTFASLLTVIILFIMPEIKFATTIVFLVFLTFLGIWISGSVARKIDIHDPSIIVIDEVIGMWISLLLVPKKFLSYLIAFLAFRFFDILKTFPINKIENWPGGWGIILDDVLAGFYSLFVVHFLLIFFYLK